MPHQISSATVNVKKYIDDTKVIAKIELKSAVKNLKSMPSGAILKDIRQITRKTDLSNSAEKESRSKMLR